MTEYAMKLMTFGRPEKKADPRTGNVKFDSVAAFTNLQNETVRCTSGYLWLTLENDVMDRVLRPGQVFPVTSGGKVIIGGKGAYAIERSGSLPKAS